MKTVPILHTDRCTLSAVTQNDIHVLRQIFDDVETQRFLSELCKEFATVESIQKFIFSFENYLPKNEGILWGIRKHDTLIGFVAIMDLSTNPTIFFAMHPKYRNQGYMQESVRLTTQYICDAKLANELHTKVNVNNIASQKILEHCGYRVGDEENNMFLYNHKRHIIMGLSAITRSGWKKNPRKQGIWNLKVSIFVSILIPLIGFLIGCESLLEAVFFTPIVLLWGIGSYFYGIWLDKHNKRAMEETDKQN